MIIQQLVSLDAKYLDHNLPIHLLNRVRELFEKKCVKKYGYVLEIQSLSSVNGNIISSGTSRANFDVSFNALTLKPEKGSEFEGTVCMCLESGVLVQIQNVMRVLIPDQQLELLGFTFDNVAKIFARSVNGKVSTVEAGMLVNVKITQIKYEKRQFHCIGKLMGPDLGCEATRDSSNLEPESVPYGSLCKPIKVGRL
jgi:DNA-directed RNA polymerase subunit E'/Rpb7